MSAASDAEEIHQQLRAVGTPERAVAERAYLKSELDHLGVKVPVLRSQVKSWLRSYEATNGRLTHDQLFVLGAALWAYPIHECRVAAVELLLAKMRLVGVDDLPWLLARLRESRTWAFVDPIAGTIVADLAVRFPNEVLPELDRWVDDSDFWIRRSAVLALRALLRRDEQLPRFFAYATKLLPEKEFFIRKVIGWVAREVAARHPEQVSDWLRRNMTTMNLVTLREPLRRLPDAVELRAMYDTIRQSTRRKSSGKSTTRPNSSTVNVTSLLSSCSSLH